MSKVLQKAEEEVKVEKYDNIKNMENTNLIYNCKKVWLDNIPGRLALTVR